MEGTTSNHHAPDVLGFTHATMAGTEGCDAARRGESLKAGLSSDRCLQLDTVKSESLVIADQHCCGEYVLGPCTSGPVPRPGGGGAVQGDEVAVLVGPAGGEEPGAGAARAEAAHGPVAGAASDEPGVWWESIVPPVWRRENSIRRKVWHSCPRPRYREIIFSK